MTGKKGMLVTEPENIEYYDSLEKVAVKVENGKGSYSSKVSLPKGWAEKRVLCLLLEEDTQEK